MKRLFLSLLAFAAVSSLLAQAVQPSLMVFPSRAWCHQNGFEKVVVKANGKEVRVQEYDKAFIDNKDLGPAVRTIGKMMQDRGFQLIDLETQLASQDLESALDNAGDEDIDISAYDKLLETAGPDIALHINYYTETQGPRETLFYDLTAFDAYTNKQVASTGLISYGPVMSVPLQTLIQSALLSSIDAFNAQLMQHFQDMQEKGREISVRINTINGWEDGCDICKQLIKIRNSFDTAKDYKIIFNNHLSNKKYAVEAKGHPIHCPNCGRKLMSFSGPRYW